jgi:hypothetical protein
VIERGAAGRPPGPAPKVGLSLAGPIDAQPVFSQRHQLRIGEPFEQRLDVQNLFAQFLG